jgi:hypothetical protein
MTAETIAAALGRYSRKFSGGFMACCPAHADKNPSLALDEKDGALLVKCFAGCEQGDVVAAMKSKGLWPEQDNTSLPSMKRTVNGPVWRPVVPVPNDAPPAPTTHSQHGEASLAWRYQSPAGELLQINNRFDTGEGQKQVLPLTYCSDGSRRAWRWQALPEPRPLYGLNLIGKEDHVLVVEGEKTTDAARRLLKKIPVLTWPGGSNAVSKADWSPLAGKTVAIWPDADAPGIKAAIAVAVACLAAGAVAVKIVEPPQGVFEGWDLADAEDQCWTQEQVLERIIAGLAFEEFRARYMPNPSPEEESHTEVHVARRIHIVEVEEFLTMQFPPRENILSPWLPRQGLTMVYAPRGIGKTHFSLGVAYAAASGGEFFGWKAPSPVGVTFIDGEMPAGVLQERLARIVASSNLEVKAPFRIVTPDLQDSGMIDLSRQEDQATLEPFLDGVGLIVVDNLSTLCRSGKESEGESWLPVQEWALRQRAAGRSVLFVHHAGKNGEQRGSSRREDVLDTVISLRRPGDYTPEKGACFEIHFEKARAICGDETKPFEAQLTVHLDGTQSWDLKALEQSTAEKVAALMNDGVPQHEIPEMLGMTKGGVSKAKKRAQESGLLKVS